MEWDARLRSELRNRGWSQAELTRRIEAKYGKAPGLKDRVYKYVAGKVKQPRGEMLAHIAGVIGWTEAELRYGTQTHGALHVPIIGHATVGERWSTVEEEGEPVRTVDVSLPGHRDVIAVRMRGSSMSPIYRDGDLLIGLKLTGSDLRDAAGRDCILQTASGEKHVKILTRGSSARSFRLRSYNATVPDIEDVAIEWAAPISIIRRA